MFIFIYMLIATSGILTICFPVCVEILSPYMRPLISPYIVTLEALIGFIALKTFVDLIQNIQLGGTFAFFTVLGILNTGFIAVFVPETKNKL